MKHTESGKSPVIHANLSNLERELQRLVGANRMTEGSKSTASTGDHVNPPESAVIAGD